VPVKGGPDRHRRSVSVAALEILTQNSYGTSDTHEQKHRVGGVEKGGGRGDGRFEEPAVAAEPGEAAFDQPDLVAQLSDRPCALAQASMAAPTESESEPGRGEPRAVRADFLVERRGFEMMAIGAFGASKSMVIRQGLLT
jgi:hypothetical protein